MNEECFTLVIKERGCQNGIPIDVDKVYSNISVFDETIIDFGYIINICNMVADTIFVKFVNIALGINVTFPIINGAFGIFDLPIDGGVFRVFVGTARRPCNDFIHCENM